MARSGDYPALESFAEVPAAATTAASSSGRRSRGIVSESKIVIGMNSIIAIRAIRGHRECETDRIVMFLSPSMAWSPGAEYQ